MPMRPKQPLRSSSSLMSSSVGGSWCRRGSGDPALRDAWRDQAQRLALPSPQPKQSLWRWLRSAG